MRQNIPLLLHLRIKLGLATECERSDYLEARWKGLHPSTLSALTIRGMQALLPVGLGAAVLLMTLGASPAKPRNVEPEPRGQVSVVRSYHLDVRIGDAHMEDDWQDLTGQSPDDALLQRLNSLASHWTSK